ncbi:uncharacterized protein LOC142224928 [Haematobia irritans]|uniref:uncharacterized protein LOC142224928 n=1 Tax=Haematobia irritans TaxID=7368 RepID=UPI003F4F983F
METANIQRTTSHFSSQETEHCENTLLPTAVVIIRHRGDTFRARAFLDQGSEKSFISKGLQQRLMLPTEIRKFEIRGLGGQVVANSNSLCALSLFYELHDKVVDIKTIVVPKITRLLPSFSIPKPANFADLNGLQLADPNFFSPGHVDLLLGSNVIPHLLLEGVRSIWGSLVAQSTIVGWVISGPVSVCTVSSYSIQTTEVSNDMLSRQLKQFWDQEELTSETCSTADDQYCEDLFIRTTFRNSEGRYVVRLPFKEDFHNRSPLGSSRQMALGQYIRMEKSTSKNPEIALEYNNVLREYLTLKHMSDTSPREISSNGSFHSFYLPHHAVIKPERRSTKVRVVFNASKRTESGRSLNDVLHVGPTLQLDLTTIILR